MDLAELDRFVTYYYEVGSPGEAREALESLCAHPSRLESHLTFFFARIARGRPGVVRELEDLFARPELDHPARLFVLSVLRLAGDEQTFQFLEGCAGDEAFASEADRIRAAVDEPLRVPLDLLAMPVEAPHDLDRVWAEFHVSGEPEPVRRVIDVLDRPDTVRARLDADLSSPPRGWIRRWRRRRALGRLETRGVYLEADRRAVASPQDLDCHCSTDGFDPSREAWSAYRKLLPFLDEKPPLEVMVKAVARWSLARNAAQHEKVLDVCEREAQRRVGRVRIALLEIVARTRLAKKELGGAFEALRASLDPETSARREIEAELAAVLELPWCPVEAERFSARAAEVALTACLDAMKQPTSYSSRFVVRASGEAEGASWDLDAMEPDKYRVRRQGSSDYDEWVTLGRHHFRGPTFAPQDESAAADERSETRWLLVDKYLTVLRDADPTAVEERDAGTARYHVLEYGPDALRTVDSAVGASGDPTDSASHVGGSLRLWVDSESKLLVRAEWERLEGRDGASGGRRLVQGFAGYDAAPPIVPPPFQLVKTGSS